MLSFDQASHTEASCCQEKMPLIWEVEGLRDYNLQEFAKLIISLIEKSLLLLD